jgi:hypothetical protein
LRCSNSACFDDAGYAGDFDGSGRPSLTPLVGEQRVFANLDVVSAESDFVMLAKANVSQVVKITGTCLATTGDLIAVACSRPPSFISMLMEYSPFLTADMEPVT